MPEAETRPFTAYVVPHTHWDREWYQPFEVFRARLVDVVDKVLDILAQEPRYRSFTLDGQAIVLEDYLALRPENREPVRRQVQQGRLRIGPWYVLADEFLVSPEALIRNLMLGQRICREFGPTMKVGYTPDSFGHISQLPLIARGFGLDSIVFERGVGDEGERLRGEFRWVAADGSSDIYAVHLLGTYSAAVALGHADWELGDGYDRQRAVGQIRTVLYGADGHARELPAWLRETFERLPQGILPYATNGAVLLLNGSDHLFPQRELPAILDDLEAAFPEVHFEHADIETFTAAARLPLDELQSFRGEFRGSRYQHVLSGVLSSRMYLKQANHRAETLLERHAEPLATLAWLDGAAYPDHLLGHAWRLLLQNHPHDSICGCSVDPVHREMLTRFASVEQLGETLARRALRALAGPNGTSALTVFNPLPYVREVVVAHSLDLPTEAAAGLQVIGPNGTPVASQLQVESRPAPGRSGAAVDRVTVKFLAELPAMGLAGYRLETVNAEAAPTHLRVAQENGTITLENRRLRLDIGAAGEATLTDKDTGRDLPLRLHFEDLGDAGDEYDFSPLEGDAPVIVATPSAKPELVHAGPVSATVRLAYHAELPERLAADRARREGSVPLAIALDLSLDATAPLVYVTAAVDNRAEDHRLRLHVASGCVADRVWADGHFDVLERPLRTETDGPWYQAPQPTQHQRRFVAVSDGKRGLAVLNRGLPEYEALAREDGVELAVTLLRCVGWLSREDLRSRPQGAGPSLPTPEAQCPGHHRFELALLPLDGPWDRSGLLEEAQAFVASPRVWQAAGAVPERSWLTLPPPLELTALKRAETSQSLVVRITNPSTNEVRGALRLWQAPREAFLVSLAEERLERIEVAGPEIALTCAPRQVVTLEIVPASPGSSEDRHAALQEAPVAASSSR